MSLGSGPNETAVNFAPPLSALHYLSSSVQFVSLTRAAGLEHTHTHTHTHSQTQTVLHHHVAGFDESDNVELICSSGRPVGRFLER